MQQKLFLNYNSNSSKDNIKFDEMKRFNRKCKNMAKCIPTISFINISIKVVLLKICKIRVLVAQQTC